MGIGVTTTPQAKVDIVELSSYIAEHNLAAAERFLDAAEASFNRLAEMSELGTRCHFQSPDAAGIRVWSIPEFGDYLIFYRLQEDAINIVRVLHGSRDIEALFGANHTKSNS